MKKLTQIVMILWAVFFTQSGFSAELSSSDNALAGYRDIKAYFDVNIGEPEKLLLRLQLIETTYSQMVASGFSPRFVVGIRGKASNFFTKDNEYILDTDIPTKKKIGSQVDQFKAHGFIIEQCSIAAGMQGIPVTSFLAPIKIVDNGYVSMIGYQSQGYAFVPMD